jgi:glutathione peroxidase
MKALLAGFGLALSVALSLAHADPACPRLLDHSFTPLGGGKPVRLCEAYAGKVLLIVNTASYCAYTPQYKGLEALYAKYRPRGLMVLGFPSNDFGSQEPGSAQQIKNFCELTYRVDFPMFEKSAVKNAGGNPIYDNLAATTGERPKWNFHKYLVSRDGTRVASFPSAVEPESPALVEALEQMLAQHPR